MNSNADCYKKIIKQLIQTDKNDVFSPALLAYTLAELSKITSGSARDEILAALNITESEIPDFKNSILITEAEYPEEYCKLSSALWGNDRIRFAEGVGKDFVTPVTMGSEDADRAIRQWLDTATGGMLKKSTANITTATSEIFRLTSALYFCANWVERFSRASTHNEEFHISEDDSVTCRMMERKISARVQQYEAFTAVEIELWHDHNIYFILPGEGKKLADCIEDKDVIDVLMGYGFDNAQYNDLNIKVPKFDVSTCYGLKDSLNALGVNSIFDSNQADFSPLTTEKDVFIGQANQSTRVKIDEKGIRGASYVEVVAILGLLLDDPVETIILNRPFLFSVADKTHLPLLVGTVKNPIK